MRVLVVDDDVVVVEFLVDALSLMGHEVATARTGHEAIAIAVAFGPDAVLLDIVLPDINGITLASVLRGVVEDRELRVIGVSGAVDQSQKLLAASARRIFDSHLVKPMSLAAIEAALREPS